MKTRTGKLSSSWRGDLTQVQRQQQPHHHTSTQTPIIFAEVDSIQALPLSCCR